MGWMTLLGAGTGTGGSPEAGGMFPTYYFGIDYFGIYYFN